MRLRIIKMELTLLNLNISCGYNMDFHVCQLKNFSKESGWWISILRKVKS